MNFMMGGRGGGGGGGSEVQLLCWVFRKRRQGSALKHKSRSLILARFASLELDRGASNTRGPCSGKVMKTLRRLVLHVAFDSGYGLLKLMKLRAVFGPCMSLFQATIHEVIHDIVWYDYCILIG